MDTLLAWDRALFVVWNNLLPYPAADLFFRFFSWVGEGYMLAILGAIGLFLFDRRRFPKNFIVFALVFLITGAVGQTGKRIFDKQRPMGDAALVGEQLKVVSDKTLPFGVRVREVELPEPVGKYDHVRIVGRTMGKFGFPSGHTSSALSMAFCLIWAFRSRYRWFWILFAIAVPWSRVHIGAHLPLDLLGGTVVGLLVPWFLLARSEKYTGLRARKEPYAGSVDGPPTIAIVTGEASSDVYGANLIRRIRAHSPDANIFGIGGQKMQESDFDCISDSKALSIVGFTGVLGSIFTIRKIYKNLLNEIERRRPQVLICIDLPDFNLMLANRAQSLGTRVVYFISPQVWAWRTSRVYTIGERVDKMIVAFPFEQEFYKKANVETEFFGHPILETLPEKLDTDETIKTRLGMDLAKKVFLLAPGSRKSEILHIADSIFEAGAMLQKRLPDWQFAVSVAPHVDLANLQKIAKRKGLTPVFVQGNFQDLLKVSSFGIITSGTATLEAALLGCPMLIVYRANAINAFVGRRLVSVDHVGLPNIVAGEELFPEFLQEDANPKNLADRALGYIEDPVKFHQISAGCEQVMQKLAGGDTSNQVANTVLAIADQARKGVRG